MNCWEKRAFVSINVGRIPLTFKINCKTCFKQRITIAGQIVPWVFSKLVTIGKTLCSTISLILGFQTYEIRASFLTAQRLHRLYNSGEVANAKSIFVKEFRDPVDCSLRVYWLLDMRVISPSLSTVCHFVVSHRSAVFLLIGKTLCSTISLILGFQTYEIRASFLTAQRLHRLYNSGEVANAKSIFVKEFRDPVDCSLRVYWLLDMRVISPSLSTVCHFVVSHRSAVFLLCDLFLCLYAME